MFLPNYIICLNLLNHYKYNIPTHNFTNEQVDLGTNMFNQNHKFLQLANLLELVMIYDVDI